MTTEPFIRHPKGWFALATVYSFTGAAIAASIVFSLLLFLSLHEEPVMQMLFGGLAIIFELGKFYVWYEYGERRARRDVSGSAWALLFYAILAAISVGGSIGGINSATNTLMSEEARHQREVARFDQQIASIERQIRLNEEAAKKYIDMQRISSGVSRLQQENTRLRLQQDTLRQERDQLPSDQQSAMMGLIQSLSEGMGLAVGQVQFLLVCFLSILLDVFGAFFVGLIGEEQRFRRTFIPRPPKYDNEVVSRRPPEPISPHLAPLRSALQGGELRPSKRQVAAHLSLPMEEVDRLFAQLLGEGVLAQAPNRHYFLRADAMAPTPN
ncbi:Preprotein translocase subunit SecY [Aeromonas schubertii]|uniref:Preprotein translocase subunit SecY n=1 Tax=Aeromonas schubertii TaxID=652 RepID=A0ABS7V8D3_9GAMM|nr:Preprotein translocase subunit SecY [Aeromonas schubertii]MBZ6065340.1 Preprotein translocase subunit SecY [Aeromonas schubertii]